MTHKKTDSNVSRPSAKSKPSPYAPPKESRCIINELPPELLSHIFLLGLQMDYEREAFGEEEGGGGDGGGGIKVLDESTIQKDDGDSDYEDVDSDDDGDDDSDSESGPDWEVLVSHVCRHWRDVAIGMPQLWSSLSFTEETPLDKPEVYLQRSRQAPISISIDYTEEAKYMWGDIRMQELIKRLRGIVQLIRPHIYHTAVLEVMVLHWEHMQEVLEFLGQLPSAPILEILQLYHYENSDHDFHPEPPVSTIPEANRKQDFVLFNNNAPLLSQVALWGVHLDWEKSTFLAGLTDFELAYHEEGLRPSYKDFSRMLQESPNLEVLTLSQSGPAGGPVQWMNSIKSGSGESDTATTEIRLPSVKEFVLAYVTPYVATSLMERLIFTSLTSLTLDLEQADFTDFISGLARPHRATGKPILADLTTLTLAGVGECRKHAIQEAFAMLGKVTTLHANFKFLSWDWYDALRPTTTTTATTANNETSSPQSQTQAHGVNSPRLDTLYSTGLDGQQLNDLLKARRDAGVPLSRLYVNKEDYLLPEELRTLQHEQGLKTFELFENSDEETDEDEDEDEDVIEMDVDDDDDDEGEYDDDDDDEGEYDEYGGYGHGDYDEFWEDSDGSDPLEGLFLF